jgi:hypothetical protein
VRRGVVEGSPHLRSRRPHLAAKRKTVVILTAVASTATRASFASRHGISTQLGQFAIASATSFSSWTSRLRIIDAANAPHVFIDSAQGLLGTLRGQADRSGLRRELASPSRWVR